jgi:MFS family permease
MDLSTTFYVLHAANLFGILQGRLLAARMVGSIVSSLSLGWLSERRGPRPVIWLGSVTALASPLLALLVHLVQPETSFYAGLVYFLVYFLLGVTTSTRMLGNTNYLMELAPEGQRPLYIGLANTLAGLLVPASLLGGFLLRATSYTVLFWVTAACVAGGIVTSLQLRDVVKKEAREAAE